MRNLTIMLIIAVLFTATVFGQSDKVKDDLAKAFKKYDVVKLNAATELAKVKANQPIKIKADGRDFEITLAEHDLRSAKYKQVARGKDGDIAVPRSAVSTFKGMVTGEVASKARFGLDGKSVIGFFKTSGGRYFIESAKNYSATAAADEFVVYRIEDALKRNGVACGLEKEINDSISRLAPQMKKAKMINAKFDFSAPFFAPRVRATSMQQGYKVFEIATDADYQYLQYYGARGTQYSGIYAMINANSDILSVLNIVEGLFEQSVGITFTINFQTGWINQDPFDNYGIYPIAAPGQEQIAPGNGSYAQFVIANFRDFWEQYRPRTDVPRDAAILYTRKNCPFHLAYPGTVCSQEHLAYAMLVGVFVPVPAGTTAHEISHLFGAGHVGGQELIDYPDCYNSIQGPSDPNRPFYDNPFRMCSLTIQQINQYLPFRDFCLTPQ